MLNWLRKIFGCYSDPEIVKVDLTEDGEHESVIKTDEDRKIEEFVCPGCVELDKKFTYIATDDSDKKYAIGDESIKHVFEKHDDEKTAFTICINKNYDPNMKEIITSYKTPIIKVPNECECVVPEATSDLIENVKPDTESTYSPAYQEDEAERKEVIANIIQATIDSKFTTEGFISFTENAMDKVTNGKFKFIKFRTVE